MKLADIGETFTKGKLQRPFLIHAATLDAVLQGWLGSTCNTTDDRSGRFGLDKPMLPTAIGELEISVDVPADAGYAMPALCRSHRHGFNDFSSNIGIFDKELSKVLLSVVDFRTSPLEMEDAGKSEGEGGVSNVDQADITSEVRWNYALDVMEPSEISQVVLGGDAATTDDRLIQVIQGSPQR